MLGFDTLTGSFSETFRLLFISAPFWLPIFLFAFAWILWRRYLEVDYISKMEWILLEVKLPLDILKSPLAMEVVLTALFQSNPGNPYERWFQGRVTRWSSLEIVSHEGDVRFYIRILAGFKNLVESRIYSQYPGVEIHEVEDYVGEIEYNGPGGEWDVWGIQYGLKKPDAYPIKTYIDYELDRQTFREEQEAAKVDPLVSLIEFFSTIGNGERLWLQILIRASKKEFRVANTWFGTQDWRGEAKELIAKLREEGKTDAVKALERSISKHGFDVGIRSMYIAKSEIFDMGKTGGLRVAFEPFNSEFLNGFKRQDGTDSEVPFENMNWDFSGGPLEWKFERTWKAKKRTFEAYRSRSWFYQPYKNRRPPFILNTEELATIYHFPGRVLETPSFVRVTTKKSVPPVNLPI